MDMHQPQLDEGEKHARRSDAMRRAWLSRKRKPKYDTAINNKGEIVAPTLRKSIHMFELEKAFGKIVDILKEDTK